MRSNERRYQTLYFSDYVSGGCDTLSVNWLEPESGSSCADASRDSDAVAAPLSESKASTEEMRQILERRARSVMVR